MLLPGHSKILIRKRTTRLSIIFFADECQKWKDQSSILYVICDPAKIVTAFLTFISFNLELYLHDGQSY